MKHSQHITQGILSCNEYIITGALSPTLWCNSLSVLEWSALTPAAAVGSCVAVAVLQGVAATVLWSDVPTLLRPPTEHM